MPPSHADFSSSYPYMTKAVISKSIAIFASIAGVLLFALCFHPSETGGMRFEVSNSIQGNRQKANLITNQASLGNKAIPAPSASDEHKSWDSRRDSRLLRLSNRRSNVRQYEQFSPLSTLSQPLSGRTHKLHIPDVVNCGNDSKEWHPNAPVRAGP
jgi:hypothetical protein